MSLHYASLFNLAYIYCINLLFFLCYSIYVSNVVFIFQHLFIYVFLLVVIVIFDKEMYMRFYLEFNLVPLYILVHFILLYYYCF